MLHSFQLFPRPGYSHADPRSTNQGTAFTRVGLGPDAKHNLLHTSVGMMTMTCNETEH
jgi:hypothetical protein